MSESMAILILLGSFFVMIFLRFPIAYAVALSSILCLLSQGLPLTTICQQMVKGINSFSLMAVPFFITMGCLMGSGGISEKLIALANACVGWMRGGMAMVNIVASYFFGGISGSAAADTASLGSLLIPMMVDQGYDDDFSTAVTITSSCEGLLVPPSHNMVIYATTAGGISVGSLFLAGYVPGAVLALSLMIGSYIISVKRNYPKGEKFSVKNLLKQLSISFWALAAILIVVVGVVCGVFTATESAAIAVIYSLLVSVFIYKGLDWKGVWRVLGDCVDTLINCFNSDCNFQYFWFLPDPSSCAGYGSKGNYWSDRQPDSDCSFTECNSAGIRMHHGYVSNYPDCNPYFASNCRIHRY